ncbi:BspA family leucine-rich repeat surface protein [Luminiphilus sp.]|nr:BspA family leucine-rich repeat surface protein [Luminiphilus sp.]
MPTAEGDNKGLFCSQTDTELRAIFNWNNGNRTRQLSWLVDVEQIGSRTKAGVACGSAGETVAIRCANQLSGGKRAFQNMVGAGGTGIRDLDTSNLDSFEKMFYRASEFDQNLSGWITADVTTIAQMFQEAGKFTNGGDPGINNWDTGKVTEMNDAFDRAVLFNHDLSGWDTSEVTTMYAMFKEASSFNGSVSSWNTSKVTNMERMFESAVAFNRDLSHFDVGLVTDMSKMFNAATVFNQDISTWTTGNVTNMTSMFQSAKAFNRDLSAWNVTKIATRPASFFKSATGWTGIDPDTNEPWCNQGEPRWGTDGTGLCLTECSDESIDWSTAATEPGWSCAVDGTAYVYADFHVIKKMEAYKDKTCESFVKDMPRTIKACASTVDGNDAYFIALGTWANYENTSFPWVDGFTQFGLNFETGGKRNQVGNRYRAFYQMGGDGGPAMSDLDTSNIRDGDQMFRGATRFNRDISGWDTRNMTSMNEMFKDAKAFNQDLSGWDVSEVKNHSNFDYSATAWCGLGFKNRGRPGGWDPSDADGCLNLEIQAPDTALAGTEVQFVLQYSNATDAEVTGGTMTFTVPDGMSVEASSGTLEGKTVTWSDLPVGGGVAEQLVTVKIDDDVQGGKLTTSATLSDGGTLSVNDEHDVTVTQLAMLSTEITAARYVAPGDVIDYQVTVGNSGLGATQGGEVTLTWDSDVPLAIVNGDATCASTSSCVLPVAVPSLGEATTRLLVRVGQQAPEGSVITASASANATNEKESSQSNASTFTDVASLPDLTLQMETLPTAVVGRGDEFKVLIAAANAGSAPAGATIVTLNVPVGATDVSASVGGTVADGKITWSLASLGIEAEALLSASMRAPDSEGAMTLSAAATTTATLPDGSTRDQTARAIKRLEVSDAPVLDMSARFSDTAVNPGQITSANFFLENTGVAPASNVELRLRVPKGTRLKPIRGVEIWGDASDASWTCDETNGTDLTPCEADQLITVTYSGDVGAGKYSSVYVHLLVDDPTDLLRVEIAGALTGFNGQGEGADVLLPQAASAQVQIVDGPILVVEQRSSQNIVAPGGKLIYDIFAENKGNIDANNALLTDNIPGDTSVVGAPGSTATDSGVEWPVTIPRYGKVDQTIALEVDDNAEVRTVLHNRVQLSSGMQVAVAEPAPVRVGLTPLLRTDIATTPELAAPGKPLVYTVSVENEGNLVAPSGALLMLSLPRDVTLSECDGCEVNEGNRLTWDLGALRPEQQETKTVSVTVKADVPEGTRLLAATFAGKELSEPNRSSSGGTLKQAVSRLQSEQRAGAMAAGSDRTTTNQRSGRLALASTLVAEASATTITVTATDEVIRGGQIGVDAVITNAGSAAAAPATVTTVLPAGTQLAYLGSGGTCSADPCVTDSTLSWTLGAQVPGAERTISYALSVDNDAEDGLRNHVLKHEDANFTQVGEATTNVVPAVLTLDKSVTDANGTLNPTYAEIGDAVTYTLRVVNGNPEDTPDLVVDITDVLPAEVIDCGSCLNLAGSGASLSGNTLTWSKLSLGAGEAIELSYGVTIPTVASTVALDNLAHVRSTTGETDSDGAQLVIASIGELGVTLAAPAGLQPDASGDVVITYQNTGTAATTATLTYLLPSNLSVTAADGASASGATYTWSLGSLAAGASGSKTLTVKAEADAPANEVLTHFASLEGAASNLAADATDTTVIGSVEELAISVSAPSPQTTGDTFTATVVASNNGNTAANGTVVKLTLPAGFTVSNAAGGTVAGQVISWNLDLPAGATQTLLPSIGTPATADTGVLSAELIAASGMTETDSTTVQVNGLTASVIQAAMQFNVTQAKAGDSVTLTAGPVNLGGGASGAITNAVVLASGFTATGYDGASWNAGTRTLSWTTASLASRGSDPKSFTLQVQDAGALSAVITSNDSTGQAAIERSYPEDVTINPETPGSSCKLSGQPTVQAAPTPPSGVTLAFANTVGFTVIDCDRNPNASYPETLSVTIDVGQTIDSAAWLYKISDAGQWRIISGAAISGQTVTYSITDDGELDQDKTPGTLRDPVALAVPPPEKPPIPVLLPIWLLAALVSSVGWMGYRRLRLA